MAAPRRRRRRVRPSTGRTAPNKVGAADYRVTSHGYVAKQVIDADGKRRTIYEHREVMEQILGRPLAKGENVHHRNGVKHDNSPENLELFVVNQPAGQRPADLVAWAREIIERYGPATS